MDEQNNTAMTTVRMGQRIHPRRRTLTKIKATARSALFEPDEFKREAAKYAQRLSEMAARAGRLVGSAEPKSAKKHRSKSKKKHRKKQDCAYRKGRAGPHCSS
jgi:hypothetical protein